MARSAKTGTLASTTAALVAGLLAGCTGRLNEATGPVGTDLPDLSAQVPPPSTTPMAMAPQEGWRPSTVDRSSWELVEIAAPRGQVETNPTPAFEVVVMPGRAGSISEVPTGRSAASVEEDGGRVALEGIADPFRSAWSLIESPHGLIVRPPWARVLAPLPTYAVLGTPSTKGAASAEMVVEPAPADLEASR